MALPIQPLEMSDFTGGITDNFIGRQNQYNEADNLLITTNGELRTRDGSVIYDDTNYQLPGGGRVSALIEHGDYLLAVCENRLYYENPTWRALTGPSGGHAFVVGDRFSVPSYDTWQDILFLTNDERIKPSKVYLDSTGTLQLRTAGLPAITLNPSINKQEQLSMAIAMANDILEKLSAHVTDTTYNHVASDTVADALLTSATKATDEDSLFDLIEVLMEAFNGHVTDALKFSGSTLGGRVYHHDLWGTPGALNATLVYSAAPTTLEEAVNILNDLGQKYYFHTWALHTHYGSGSDQYGLNPLNTTSIEVVTNGPKVEPNYDRVFAYANELKEKLNAHFEDVTDVHIEHPDGTSTAVAADDATDLNSLYVLIHHCWYAFFQHLMDAQRTFSDGVADATAGSASLTNVKTATGATLQLSENMTIIDGGGGIFPQSPVAKVISAGAGTATLSADALGTQLGAVFKYTTATQHYAQDATLTPASVSLFATIAGHDIESQLETLTDLVELYSQHESNSTIHRTGFAHSLTAPAPTLGSYLYAFAYEYEYTVGGLTYLDIGPTHTVGPVVTCEIYPSTLATEGSPVTISNIPTLTNGVGDNYDTDEIALGIYRTINAGSTYYKVDAIDNGTSTYEDTLGDTVTGAEEIDPLNERETIYTTGGVVDNDPPPRAKCIHVVNNFAYYGNIEESGEILQNRIRQSIANDPDSCPGDFYVDVDDVVVGLSSARSNPIVFGDSSLYRLEGSISETGEGAIVADRIFDEAGALNQACIVRTDIGIFFASRDGFYYTDGFQVLKISNEFNERYQKYTKTAEQRRRIAGAYDSFNRRVWWAVQSSETVGEVDACFVLDLNFGINERMPFTTASGGESFRPTALLFRKDGMVRGDSRGYLFQHGSSYKTDPKIDTSTTPTYWGTELIRYNYLSCGLDFGTTMVRKWATRINLQAKEYNASIQINSINDRDRKSSLSPIRHRSDFFWGDPNFVWGKSSFIWRFARGVIDHWRRFVSGSLRFNYKQIQITNAYCVVTNSDDRGTLTYDSTWGNNLATLSRGPWPTDVSDYLLSVKHPNGSGYTKEIYTLTYDRDAKTMTLNDPWVDGASALIDETDITGLDTIIQSGTGKVVVLFTTPSSNWTDYATEDELVGAYFFPGSGSAAGKGFKITGVNGQSLTLADPLGELDSVVLTGFDIRTSTYAGDKLPSLSAVEWELWGYPKNERLHLLGYTIQWSPHGRTQKDSLGGADKGRNG